MQYTGYHAAVSAKQTLTIAHPSTYLSGLSYILSHVQSEPL